MQTELKRDAQLDILRVILVFLVIYGHSTFYRITTNYGGINYYDPLFVNGLRDSNVHIVLDYIKGIIYKFHMPTFIFLSGNLFRMECDKNKYSNIVLLVSKKFRRLIIPYILVWLFWNIPIKYISGYYQSKDNSLVIAIMQIFNPYQVHLWYLVSLFFVFVFYFFLKNLSKKWIKVVISLILYLVGVLIRNKFGAPLGNPFLYVIWFEIGYDGLYKKCDKKIWNIIYIFCLIAMYYASLKIHYSWLLFDLLMGYSGIQLLYNFSKSLCSFLSNNQIINTISKHSLGIYLYSDPLNYLIIFIFIKLFGIESLANSSYALLLFVLRFVLTFFMAYFIDVLIRKCKFSFNKGEKHV